MDVLVKLLEGEIVSIFLCWFLVQLLFAHLNRLLGLSHKLSLVFFKQLHGFPINLRLLVVDCDAAETHFGAIKHILNILEHLPDVILVHVPVRKGVQGVQKARTWAYEGMEGRVVEDYLLEKIDSQ